jgi:hypothetical protein
MTRRASFYGELKEVFYHLLMILTDHIQIMLREFNILGTEDLYKPTLGNES